MGHWLRENKGARLLLLLALVSVPVNFAILGAFIYSASHVSEVTYPVFATWQAEGLMATPIFMCGAIVSASASYLARFSGISIVFSLVLDRAFFCY
ncbi:hypothetical protein [Nitrosococcus oceani]|uniref:hypothetical protein n=1 Tax=Nitrosococcus oceani TaxID=1229 RepID=UPI0012E02CE2|nr:hypothetical protein [Nitrosococcus oceani]